VQAVVFGEEGLGDVFGLDYGAGAGEREMFGLLKNARETWRDRSGRRRWLIGRAGQSGKFRPRVLKGDSSVCELGCLFVVVIVEECKETVLASEPVVAEPIGFGPSDTEHSPRRGAEPSEHVQMLTNLAN
jgi:hypothetical protein